MPFAFLFPPGRCTTLHHTTNVAVIVARNGTKSHWYRGQVCPHGQPRGKGTITVKNREERLLSVEGTFSGFTPVGVVRMEEEGVVYVGPLQQGLKHTSLGHMAWERTGADAYTGQFMDDKRHGRGVLRRVSSWSETSDVLYWQGALVYEK